MESSLAVIPPSSSAGLNERMAVILLVVGLQGGERELEGFWIWRSRLRVLREGEGDEG